MRPRPGRIIGWSVALLVMFAVAPPVEAQGTGSVEGIVSVRRQPARRSAGRYPGAAPAAHSVQEVPAVVYILGRIGGDVGRTARSATEVLAQRDTAFAPAGLVVEVGTTVRFPNEDPFFHNVFSYSAPARFDLGRYPKGEAKEVTFDKPGVVKVYCEVHEFMRSVILVTENPFHAVVGPDGSYRIDGIPVGTYTVVIWHADQDPQEQEIRITAGGVTRVNAELG